MNTDRRGFLAALSALALVKLPLERTDSHLIDERLRPYVVSAAPGGETIVCSGESHVLWEMSPETVSFLRTRFPKSSLADGEPMVFCFGD